MVPRVRGSSRAGEVGGFAYVGPPRARGSSHAAGSAFGFRSFACRLHGSALSSVLLLVVSWSVPSSTELDHCFLGSSPGPGLTGQRLDLPGRGECGKVGVCQSPWQDGFCVSRARLAHPLGHSSRDSDVCPGVLLPTGVWLLLGTHGDIATAPVHLAASRPDPHCLHCCAVGPQ